MSKTNKQQGKRSTVQHLVSLSPCPFCGNKAKLISDFNDPICKGHEDHCFTAVVRCSGCFANGPLMDSCYGGTEDMAINLWNFRIKKGYVRPKPEPRYDKAYFEFVAHLDSEG